jgi:hypothetical protein
MKRECGVCRGMKYSELDAVRLKARVSNLCSEVALWHLLPVNRS